MALSDCPKCWDTPCTCGYYWRDYSLEAKKKQVEAIMGEEMYGKDEVIQLLIKAISFGESIPPIDTERQAKYWRKKINKWIEENLLL